MGFCKFCILYFTISLASSAFANIPSHHFGFGNSFYGFCDFAQNDSNRSPGVGWDETKWNPSIKHDRKSKTLGYASLSQPTLRTKATDSLGAVIDVGYDKVGNRTSERNGLGETTIYSYDNLNRRVSQKDNLGTRWTGSYDHAGNLITETDANSVQTTHTWDKNNRRLTSTRAGLRIETNEYDPAGNLLFRTDARGTKEGWEYDPRNLVTAHNRPLAMITKYTRDNMGNVIEERDPEGRRTVNTFDNRRRLTSQTIVNATSGSETTRTAYDANNNVTQITRPKGGSTTTTYTAHNQPDTITSAAGQSNWTYNRNGVPTSRTDANRNTTSYTVDPRGRRTNVSYAGGTGSAGYTYDLANRIRTTTENAITTTHTFDARGRETQRTYSGGNLISTTYTYDGNGNRTSETVTDASGTRTATTQYDPFNRPEIVIDTFGNRLHHTYDANGNRKTTTAPGITGNQVTTYTHDVNNNLTNLQSGAANISWQYDRSGRVTKTTLGGLTTDQTWDGAARLASRTHKTGSGTQQSFAYTYDKNGNRVSETRNLGTGIETITYSYDADDRLTNVTHSDGRSETYTLDANGNRRTITRSGYLSENGVTTNTFDARGRIGQKQTPSGTTSYTWDAAGNLTQVQSGTQTTTYTWNAENQLIGIQQNGSNVANYRYTGGLRDQIQSAGDTTRTVWSDGFAFLKQDSGGQTLTRTEHAGIKALYLTSAYGNEVLLRDGLDSVTGSFANGALQSRTDYSAWGEATQTGSTQSNHGYTGHLQDETGLIYARARYYDPSIGRFISRDPLEGLLDSPITWNAYVYGNANPFYYVDPTGQMAELEELRDNLRGASHHLGEIANETTGSADLLWNILQRASLEVLAVGVSGVNIFADATVLAGSKTGIWSDQRVYESGDSLGKSTEAVVNTYNFFRHDGGVGKTYDAVVDNTSRWMEGDRQAASNMGTVFTSLASPGIAPATTHGARLVHKAASQAEAIIIKEAGKLATGVEFVNRAAPPKSMHYQRGAVGDIGEMPRLVAPKMHDHHLMPRQFKDFFSKRGIDVDAHTVSLGEKSHLVGVHGKGLGNMPGGWNREWVKWISENPNATTKDIYQQLGTMMDRYKINDLPIHSFRK